MARKHLRDSSVETRHLGEVVAVYVLRVRG